MLGCCWDHTGGLSKLNLDWFGFAMRLESFLFVNGVDVCAWHELVVPEAGLVMAKDHAAVRDQQVFHRNFEHFAYAFLEFLYGKSFCHFDLVGLAETLGGLNVHQEGLVGVLRLHLKVN